MANCTSRKTKIGPFLAGLHNGLRTLCRNYHRPTFCAPSRFPHRQFRSQPQFIIHARKVATEEIDDYYESGDYTDEDEDGIGDEVVPRRSIKSSEQNDREWMFFDVATINVKAGDGGDGCMAMQREFRVAFGGPCGGNGGNGGSIYLQCDKRLNTLGLLRRKVHHRARYGTIGKGDSRHGASAEDVFVPVPPGTIVRDSEGALIGELNTPGQVLLVARGGVGGRGNEHFKTARMNAPTFAEKGEPGEERWLHVELKLIADVGLVGVPNAGKSTLLAASSNAKPKIADYPFTTVVPNLGVCDVFSEEQSAAQGGERRGRASAPATAGGRSVDVNDGAAAAAVVGGGTTAVHARLQTQGMSSSSAPAAGPSSLVVADIPGLLEGAHAGVGLGTAFLRHIQRCRVLVHVVNGDSADALGDFTAINQELQLFNPQLALKAQVVVVNKIDIPAVREALPGLAARLRQAAGHSRVMGISAATGENVRELMRRVHKLVRAVERDGEGAHVKAASGASTGTGSVLGQGAPGAAGFEQGGAAEEVVSYVEDGADRSFEVLTDDAHPGQFRVQGKHIEKVVAMTNWDYYEAVRRFQRILEAQGISRALKEAGAKQGDVVMVGDWDFNYWEPRNRWIAELGLEDVNPRKRELSRELDYGDRSRGHHDKKSHIRHSRSKGKGL